MQLLEISPAAADDIFISHPDFDHIGGLCHVLNQNPNAVIHNPVSFRGVKYPNQVKYYGKPVPLYEGIYTTGELASIEQSLAIQTVHGWVVIIGCAHPGVGLIMDTVLAIDASMPIYAMIGGLHGFDEFPLLSKVSKICPTHCSKHSATIRDLFPEKFIPGGAGAIIEF